MNAKRTLRVGGIVVLTGVLIAFVVSFLGGLGDGTVAPERVTGDARQGGRQLDRLGPRVRVEVLNAGGVAGLAGRATEHLRDHGFDVVYLGNAATFARESTVVLARTADIRAAERVAAALGTDSVAVAPDPQLFVDATVLLGRDWPPAPPDSEQDSGLLGRVEGWFR